MSAAAQSTADAARAEEGAVAAAVAVSRRTGGPFPITVLNVVFGFAAQSARDAALRLGLVCRLWQETQFYYAADMWRVLIQQRWPGDGEVRGRMSRQAYERRAATQQASGFHEIENCASAELAFRCPILLENMARTGKVSAENGLDIFHCAVCERDIFPVTNAAELERAGAGNRCVRVVAPASGALQAARR